MSEPRTRTYITTSGAPGATMATIHEVEEPMSVTDESNVPHRPPQVGDRVEVRATGRVQHVWAEDGVEVVRVALDADQVEHGIAVQRADRVAILRDQPRYRPGQADNPPAIRQT